MCLDLSFIGITMGRVGEDTEICQKIVRRNDQFRDRRIKRERCQEIQEKKVFHYCQKTAPFYPKVSVWLPCLWMYKPKVFLD